MGGTRNPQSMHVRQDKPAAALLALAPSHPGFRAAVGGRRPGQVAGVRDLGTADGIVVEADAQRSGGVVARWLVGCLAWKGHAARPAPLRNRNPRRLRDSHSLWRTSSRVWTMSDVFVKTGNEVCDGGS